jgi:hypothetical protein
VIDNGNQAVANLLETFEANLLNRIISYKGWLVFRSITPTKYCTDILQIQRPQARQDILLRRS